MFSVWFFLGNRGRASSELDFTPLPLREWNAGLQMTMKLSLNSTAAQTNTDILCVESCKIQGATEQTKLESVWTRRFSAVFIFGGPASPSQQHSSAPNHTTDYVNLHEDLISSRESLWEIGYPRGSNILETPLPECCQIWLLLLGVWELQMDGCLVSVSSYLGDPSSLFPSIQSETKEKSMSSYSEASFYVTINLGDIAA